MTAALSSSTGDTRPLSPRTIGWNKLATQIIRSRREANLTRFDTAVLMATKASRGRSVDPSVVQRAESVLEAIESRSVAVNPFSPLRSVLPETARRWFPYIDEALGWPKNRCESQLSKPTDVTIDEALGWPKNRCESQFSKPTDVDLWAGMENATPPTDEDETPEPEAECSVFEALDEKPSRRQAVEQDLAAISALHNRTNNQVESERDRLVRRVADISTNFIDAITALERLRVPNAPTGALRAAKNTASQAFTEALKAIAGTEESK